MLTRLIFRVGCHLSNIFGPRCRIRTCVVLRPYLPYTSGDKQRKYFADFYLEDYDVYLDPKNDFLIPGDTIKINMVSEQTGKKIIILDKNQLSWDSIKIVLGIGFEPTMWS